MSQRELFAGMALMGMCALAPAFEQIAHTADIAVQYADALIAALEKPR